MKKIICSLILVSVIAAGCSSVRTNTEFYGPIMNGVKAGDFEKANAALDSAFNNEEYAEKDRVLYYLDRGALSFYAGRYAESSQAFEKADFAMEDLFTKSISKAAASMLLNDNALDYSGEVYENIYVNVFSALDYIARDDIDGAYVEANRVNIKLRQLEDKYNAYVDNFNASKDAKIKLEPKKLDYYNNALANYLSHIIFRAEGEYDNSRISLEKLDSAWAMHPDVYNFSKPSFVKNAASANNKTILNVMAFAGNAPEKQAENLRIMTFDDFLIVQFPDHESAPIIFPGLKQGWYFKFSMPSLAPSRSDVRKIEVYANDKKVGSLELLENMNNVAVKTFEMQKSIIYFKSIIRTVLKGIGSAELKQSVRKSTGEGLGGFLSNLLVDIAVDATENADLRCWRTMPGYCYAGEFELEEGEYNIDIVFLDGGNKPISKTTYSNYKVNKKGLNLLNAACLN
ncbi:MAG TPA: hypothetical protein VHO28_08605 [Ignavibacteriales bacterium]|nr:hypothetical protein [Ignavibacteriales bacterium]